MALRGYINCEVCGKVTPVYPCESGRKRYCSKACVGVANGRRSRKYDVRTLVAAINTDACVEWPGSKTRRGYGKTTLDGKEMNASAAAFIASGGKLLRGQMVCHTCDNPPCINPPCINPRHLYAGTGQTNADDMVMRGRSLKGEKNAAAKLTSAQASLIRVDKRSGRAIAKDYGVGKSTVTRIKRGAGWKNI